MPLPPGLTLNPATGRITGRPTAAGTYTGTIRVRDAIGTFQDVPYSIEILPYDPPVVSSNPPVWSSRGVAYSHQFTVADGTGPFTWTVLGTLPDGVTMTAGGLLSGTPTSTSYGARSITAVVTDGAGSKAQKAFTFQYSDRLALSGQAHPAVIGQAWEFTPTRTGGHTPITYTLAGSLPPGFAFNASTGRLSGTGSAEQAASLTITATDASGLTATLPVALQVVPAYVPVALTGALGSTSVTYQRASGSQTLAPGGNLAATGGSGVITCAWARTSGSSKVTAAAPSSLATGFTIDAEPGESVEATFTLTATDGQTSATYTVTISGSNTYAFPALSGTLAGYATRTKAYSSGFTLTGGKAPITWTASGLPAGLAINASTGVISGTPTATTGYGNLTFAVTATDAEGQKATRNGAVAYAGPPSLTEASASVYRTQDLDIGPALSGGHAPITWEVTGTLPAGTTFNTATGRVTGTTTTAGNASLTVTATDAAGNQAAAVAVSIEVKAYTAPSITAAAQVKIVRGVATSEPGFTAANGVAPYSYAIASGSLPSGLTLNASTGVISGTTTAAAGTYSITGRVTDAIGNTATSSGSATRVLADAPAMTGRAFTRRQRGQAINESVAASGNIHGPATYAIISGALPTGASLNASTGAITGTLSGTSYTNYSATIRVTDAVGTTASAVYTLEYANTLALSVAGDTEGTVGKSVSLTATASGGFSGKTFTVSPALPAGLSINATTGAITGTATAANANTTYTVTVSDGNASATATFALRIYDALALGKSLGSGTQNTAYSGSVTASGGKTAYTYAVASGAMPAGLSLNASTGAVTGTPTGYGNTAVTFLVTDALGNQATVAHTFVIAQAVYPLSVTITGNPVQLFQNGTEYPGFGTNVTGGSGTKSYSWSLTLRSGTPFNRLKLAGSTNTSGISLESTGNNTTNRGTLSVTVSDSTGSATDSVELELSHGVLA